MTDEALAGGADAPAEPTGAPVSTEAPSQPQPLGSQTPVAEKPEAKPEPEKAKEPSQSAREALQRASQALKDKEAKEKAQPAPKAAEKTSPEPAKIDPKPEPKEQPKTEDRPRHEDGKFAPREAPQQSANPEANPPKPNEIAPDPRNPYREAPQRFSNDAKAAWEQAPEPIKAEVHRAIRELEQGHQKYRASAEAYERIKEFDEIAKGNGRDLRESLQKVTEIETALARNPIAGLDMILREIGPKKPDGSPVTLLDVAAHVMNQKPEDRAMQQNSTIAALQNEISTLKQQLSGVSQTIRQQQETASLQQVQAFAQDHPRFDELAEDIGFFLETKRASTLQEAYELAERLNPAPPKASDPPAAKPASQPEPLNPAGQKSISGAPSAGSDPALKAKTPAPSTREALKRAFAQAG